MCGKKKRYSSKSKAMTRALDCLYHGDPTVLRAYKCPYCQGWHLTSKPYGDSKKGKTA